MISQKSNPIILLPFIAFLLHLVWENVQAPLFQGYFYFTQHFFICFIGALGDVVFTLIVYLVVSLLKKDFDWVKKFNSQDTLALAIIGFLLAVAIEQNALLLGKWSYTSAMPLIPYLKVGLTPVLQMMILLPISFYLTKVAFYIKLSQGNKPV